jgi:hypothetical protein
MKDFFCRTAILVIACWTVFSVAAAQPPLLTPSKTIAHPAAPAAQEDCIAFNRNNLTVKVSGSEHAVMDASNRLFYFRTAADATNAIATIRKHGFSRQCFVGRPFSAGSGMTYLLP